jgi:toxic protein SymE
VLNYRLSQRFSKNTAHKDAKQHLKVWLIFTNLLALSPIGNRKNIFMVHDNRRRVKLHSKYRALQNSSKQVPWLNISGVWLEKAGFKAGDQVEITIKNNLLIIKNCEGDANFYY